MPDPDSVLFGSTSIGTAVGAVSGLTIGFVTMANTVTGAGSAAAIFGGGAILFASASGLMIGGAVGCVVGGVVGGAYLVCSHYHPNNVEPRQ